MTLIEALEAFDATNEAHRHWVMATYHFTHDKGYKYGPDWQPFLIECPFYSGLDPRKFDIFHLFGLLRERCLHGMAKESPMYLRLSKNSE